MDFDQWFLNCVVRPLGAAAELLQGEHTKDHIAHRQQVINTSVRNPSKHCYNLLLTVHQLDNQNYLTQDNVA